MSSRVCNRTFSFILTTFAHGTMFVLFSFSVSVLRVCSFLLRSSRFFADRSRRNWRKRNAFVHMNWADLIGYNWFFSNLVPTFYARINTARYDFPCLLLVCCSRQSKEIEWIMWQETVSQRHFVFLVQNLYSSWMIQKRGNLQLLLFRIVWGDINNLSIYQQLFDCMDMDIDQWPVANIKMMNARNLHIFRHKTRHARRK